MLMKDVNLQNGALALLISTNVLLDQTCLCSQICEVLEPGGLLRFSNLGIPNDSKLQTSFFK